MNRILYSGASGIKAQMTRLDTVANNLANVHTPSYKARDTAFADLVYQELARSGKPVDPDNDTACGSGARVTVVLGDFTQGSLVESNNPLSIAVDGKGFLLVEDEAGREYFTRDGNFHRDAGGNLVSASGFRLPGITLPGEAQDVTIEPGGAVKTIDEEGDVQELGQINLYLFVNPQGLERVGDNLYRSTPQSGDPEEYAPGNEEAGQLRQGYLEMSNASVTREMVKMISAQRSIQLSAQAVRIADQLWEMANNIRR